MKVNSLQLRVKDKWPMFFKIPSEIVCLQLQEELKESKKVLKLKNFFMRTSKRFGFEFIDTKVLQILSKLPKL